MFGFRIVHSRHLLHDHWWSERGQSQGLFKKGTNFHNLDKQGWALGQCSLERKTSLHHSLTLPPYGLEGVNMTQHNGSTTPKPRLRWATSKHSHHTSDGHLLVDHSGLDPKINSHTLEH
ncbi:hypothetical protein E2C01_005464 [Portunus trituberculatus]|uniref:Uncharacterized protein n=1 Tax=Portunus trituberculatus TaxID=210409 RepID=A0A5B7CSI7_PORTR|nr:hypothetical protein [Portunus trituberculatus]